MRKRIPLTVLVLICLLFTGFQVKTRTLWEYKQTCNFKDANKLGAEGWEMVGVEGGDAVSCFYFKRAL